MIRALMDKEQTSVVRYLRNLSGNKRKDLKLEGNTGLRTSDFRKKT